MEIKFKNEGFTLIELIVVIGILGILAVGALLVLNPLAQFQKANDVRRKSDLAQIQRALEVYYQDNNKYPIVATAPYQIPGVSWGNSWQPYMDVLPQDPSSSKNYVYYSPSGQSYYIYASLDRGSNDPAACSGGLCSAPANSSINMQTACGSGGDCNYGVSSPDVTP
ncbi:MAG: prepilin-type N-terminal cleavage/methylation domain-containing protein [Candidatus Levyibacteriota bacterium]|jgi:general secretion pathway protein G